MSEFEILFDVKDGLGVITLNRPKALNALTHGMILELERVIPGWEKDPAIKAVVLRGAGDRAFCAGGDVIGLYREMTDNPGGTLRRDFFRDEYIVNRRIYRYAKPWISLIDGIDMGGGVGLSAHGSHSVASEKFLFAMPETTIGLFPDVGGGYFLTRLAGALGTYLALTSHRLKAADALWAGIVDAHVPSVRMGELLEALGAADLSGPQADRKVDAVIARFATDPGPPGLPAMMADIDRCFSAESVGEIVARLRKQPGDWAQKQLAALLKLSPLSMAITLEQLKRCANRSFEDAMTIEYRMAQHCMRPDHDFFEGVRALLVDKDQKPRWNPPAIEGVTRQMVDAHFEPVTNDLCFD
ncbi:MAG: enoyl-CoA hydratase/isomerase family protein [Alphaproteobacteria bacterium]|nr:enoyl-CoA hydratase/isomerase family protein [Alphaproteobacteria bacterium]